MGAGGDYVRKVAAQAALAAYRAYLTQNTGNATGSWFIGQVNPNRTQILHPNGNLYDLVFTGQVGSSALACMIGSNLAFAVGPAYKPSPIFQSTGGYVILLQSQSTYDLYVQSGSSLYLVDTTSVTIGSVLSSMVNSSSFRFEASTGFSQSGNNLYIATMQPGPPNNTIYWAVYKGITFNPPTSPATIGTVGYSSISVGSYNIPSSSLPQAPAAPETDTSSFTGTFNQSSPTVTSVSEIWTSGFNAFSFVDGSTNPVLDYAGSWFSNATNTIDVEWTSSPPPPRSGFISYPFENTNIIEGRVEVLDLLGVQTLSTTTDYTEEDVANYPSFGFTITSSGEELVIGLVPSEYPGQVFNDGSGNRSAFWINEQGTGHYYYTSDGYLGGLSDEGASNPLICTTEFFIEQSSNPFNSTQVRAISASTILSLTTTAPAYTAGTISKYSYNTNTHTFSAPTSTAFKLPGNAPSGTNYSDYYIYDFIVKG